MVLPISLLSDTELARTRVPGKSAELLDGIAHRADKYVRGPGIVSTEDTMEWWHVVWERLGDVAFAHRLAPSARYRDWLRDEVLAICERPVDDWVGPFFRERGTPLRGTLETAHIGLAVVTAVALCPQEFTDSEHEAIRTALREKCLTLCKEALDNFLTSAHLNNWYMVLLNGFGSTAAFLGDSSAVSEAVSRFAVASGLFNEDSYGESLQYWSYASHHLAHLREILTRYDSKLNDSLDLSCYTRCIPWAVQSYLYSKPMSGWGDHPFPRALNFGDSTVMFRPTADLLLHISARAKDLHPTEAGLARWLFEQTFAIADLGPDDRASFGFFNQFQWMSAVLLSESAPALTPADAKLPLGQGFECGTVAVRDDWASPQTTFGAQAGHGKLKVTSHRHRDENSFVLTHRGERFFADPGHCCYRLAAQTQSVATDSHTTWTFSDDHTKIPQQFTANRRRILQSLDEITVVRSDAAAAYGDPVIRAERTWITAFPHLLLIIDRISARGPIQVRSNFVLNNRDNALRTNVATNTRLVFRRNGVAMKFFQLQSSTPSRLARSWGHLHDIYHPQPNQPGQSREGAAQIYVFESTEFATEHTMMYSAVMDTDDRIKSWHVTKSAPGHFAIAFEQTRVASLRHGPGAHIEFADETTGLEYQISDDAVVRR